MPNTARIMTSFFRAGDSLSFRLHKLHSYYSNEMNIWDIGCDHGLLGLSFNDYPQVKSIGLVDPSGPVIDVLRNKLKDSYITKASIFHKHGQEIEITQSSNCIFIAGMGGKEIGDIILHLLPQLDSTSRIVISPHRKILELRSMLNALPVSLHKEEVIHEDGQFYQILDLIPHREGQKVSLYGDDIWKSDDGDQYLVQQLQTFNTHRDESSLEYIRFLKVQKSLKSPDKSEK